MNVMETIQHQLEILSRSFPGGMTTVTLGLIFVAVILAVFGVAVLFGRDPVQRRLAGDKPKRTANKKKGVPTLRANLDQEGRWDELL